MNLPLIVPVPGDTPGKEIPSFRRIEPALGQVRERIRRTLAAHSPEPSLTALIDHLRTGCGKMLRPGVVLLAGECFGPLREEHVGVAAMVEMIHHATLLHDDVIDDGRRRRGVPTVNCLWGNESAVLLGDFVLSQVFRLAADLEAEVSKILAQTAVRVCEGELRQVLQERNWQLGEPQYLDIIAEKSASFFSGCGRLGAVLSHAGRDQVEALARFGLLAGIAFQITDDLLDIAGDESRMGKTPQRDFAKDKPTLAVIHLLRTIETPRRAEVCALLESTRDFRSELVEMLDRHGSLHYARARAAAYITEATAALEQVPASPAKEALIETARFLVDRTA
ncbi:MAG: polyprenyl synthetase family protein [Planctomycetes bacterium]|nr:polyprenyl synthetase family protein [Planctomycetota bacterium]